MSASHSISEQWAKDMTPAEFAAMRGDIANTFGQIIGWGKEGDGSIGSKLSPTAGTENAGAFVAGMSPAEKRQLSAMNTLAAQRDNTLDKHYGRALDAAEQLDPDANPFTQKVVAAAQRPLVQANRRENLERQGVFARAGHSLPESSPFHTAQAIGQEAYYNALGDTAAKIHGQQYQGAQDRMQTAATGLSQLNQIRFQRGLENLTAQALPRLIEQQGIDKGVADFNFRINLLSQILGMATGAASPTLGQFGKSESVSAGLG